MPDESSRIGRSIFHSAAICLFVLTLASWSSDGSHTTPFGEHWRRMAFISLCPCNAPARTGAVVNHSRTDGPARKNNRSGHGSCRSFLQRELRRRAPIWAAACRSSRRPSCSHDAKHPAVHCTRRNHELPHSESSSKWFTAASLVSRAVVAIGNERLSPRAGRDCQDNRAPIDCIPCYFLPRRQLSSAFPRDVPARRRHFESLMISGSLLPVWTIQFCSRRRRACRATLFRIFRSDGGGLAARRLSAGVGIRSRPVFEKRCVVGRRTRRRSAANVSASAIGRNALGSDVQSQAMRTSRQSIRRRNPASG